MSEATRRKPEIERVTRTHQEAKSSYDRMSGWYDLLTDRSERKSRDLGLKLLQAREGEKALVIGCGTGHGVLTLMRDVGNTGKVFGIDLSEGMLAVTRERLLDAGLAGRMELECADATALPFATEVFDAAFMSFTLELFDTPEIPVVLRECRRVLKVGGRICVVGMSRQGKDSLMIRLYEWAHRKMPGYVDCRPIYVQEVIEQAGFRVVKAIKNSIWGLPVEIVQAENPTLQYRI
ncbi:MAG: class I SAM-dependent methyltransferase [Acidobacteria bacterium]|nr:class I SAM-dependent methyltransferase [Acidobacteriota bacterium]